MLKNDNLLFFALILLPVELTWSEVLSYPLAFLGALAVRNGWEWENNTLTRKSFVTRLLYTFGLTVLLFLIWTKDFNAFGYVINKAVALFFTTLASDIIVKRLIKFIVNITDRYFKKKEESI